MKYVFLGQSVTAVKFIEKLRSHDNDAEVVMIGFDEGLPACSERYPELIARQISRDDVLYHNEKFYRNLRVEFISDKKINRINFKKRTIFFDDKSRMECDVIIVADADKDKFPDIKGTNKEGVYSLRSRKQIIALLDEINRIDTILLESETLRGILIAQSLASQDKEVILCIPSGNIWADMLDQGASDFIISLLQNSGVRIIRKASICEVLGETDVKAVRLSIGKVIAAEIVIFPDVMPDIKMYTKSDISGDQNICTDNLLRTNFEGVFAIDDAAQCVSVDLRSCNAKKYRDDQVGRLIAAVKNEEYEVAVDAVNFNFEISGHEIRIMGVLIQSGSEIFVKKDENGFLQKRIFVKNNVVQGAFLVDNTDIAEDLFLLIQEGRKVDLEDSKFFGDCVRESDSQDLPQTSEDKEFGVDFDCVDKGVSNSLESLDSAELEGDA